MAIYLNRNNTKFASCKEDVVFVDKSLLIKETNACFGKDSKSFMCVTRPRRFGKSMALKMLNAYYSKGCDSKELFADLAIAKDPSFEKHLNKHNVLWVDMSEIYSYLDDPNDFLKKLEAEVIAELKENYSGFDFTGLKLGEAIRLINSKKGDAFIFLIDEWDVIYREQPHNRKLCEDYTTFLHSLFKTSRSSECFDLVYMTGIFPIRRYRTQSSLNMFEEYNMLDPDCLAPYFGFTENEVKELCRERGVDFSEIKSWYDGYRLGGMEIYNPKSVSVAVQKKKCSKYWVESSAIEAVTDYMNYDHGVLKGEIMRMLAGERVELNPSRFKNDLTEITSKDAALTVLVHLGYLAFLPDPSGSNGSCYIPNEEIREEFVLALQELDWEEIYDPISHSDKLLDDTKDGKLDEINRILDKNHKELASPFSKSDEDVLALVIIVSYYNARKQYWVRKEEISMNGRSDVSFFPRKPGLKPIIVELKVGKSPDEAIAQIKKKAYWEAWDGYKGDVLLVGINYEEETLKHASKVEWIKVQ